MKELVELVSKCLVQLVEALQEHGLEDCLGYSGQGCKWTGGMVSRTPADIYIECHKQVARRKGILGIAHTIMRNVFERSSMWVPLQDPVACPIDYQRHAKRSHNRTAFFVVLEVLKRRLLGSHLPTKTKTQRFGRKLSSRDSREPPRVGHTSVTGKRGRDVDVISAWMTDSGNASLTPRDLRNASNSGTLRGLMPSSQ
ncbi:hypothetical protein BDM02DRAFT_1975053 [Thelephora ganbajun]|uniref:Uncharacterized protein n=1 Tax=Thelephora ganbajun TaxID=370292 RepID=A0ACB6YZ27_THEGA|nr:hypothetical protein BDM02DRAFT_1975053 [Thelephora ganbajun]